MLVIIPAVSRILCQTWHRTAQVSTEPVSLHSNHWTDTIETVREKC